MMAMGGGAVDGFIQSFRALQAHGHAATEQLIQDLISYTETIEPDLQAEILRLKGQLDNLRLDLDDATASRRELQQRLKIIEANNEVLRRENIYLKNANTYVIALIDGNGLLFTENYIRQGTEGGKQAAHVLYNAILQQCHSAPGIEVIVKIYANLDSLSNAMWRNGIIQNEADLSQFFSGFSQCKATFDFVDVGWGEQLVDDKIKETASWHLKNHNCKHLLLGISHNDEYAPFLNMLFKDPLIKDMITILEGTPTVPELFKTGPRIMVLDENPFRSDKIDYGALVPPIAPPNPKNTKTSGPAASPTTTPSNLVPNTAPPATYARAIQNSTPPAAQVALPKPRPVVTPTRAAPKKPTPAPWNPGRRGLDPPLEVSQAALDNIKKRKDHNKLCNNHYLRGPCSKGNSCCFEHKYKVSQEEKTAIAFLARLNPCEGGQECEVKNCIYGHHCPSTRPDGICTNPHCKFGLDQHPPGTKFAKGRGSH